MPTSAPSPSLLIITGTSRGLGEAMAAQSLRAGHAVIGIARQHSEALDQLAVSLGASLQQWRHDLSEPEPAGIALLEWLQAQPVGRFGSAMLVNNAGVLAPMLPLVEAQDNDIARVLRVCLEAPMVLTRCFLRGTWAWAGARKVLNVSSGLGRRAMAGSASYCAAKAGMDHFSRALALEEARLANGARIVSLAPGVIDTGMQDHLRAADPGQFPDRSAFVALKREGQLQSPEAAAARVLAWADRQDFGQTTVCDVRDA
jgi:NAD(P)-dependent dehydrogenase (short-subunit alcohol dehydrogenase family)